MSISKLVTAIGMLALVASSASAEGIRYQGGPKTGQTLIQRGQAGTAASLDARAEIAPPQRAEKGGIASRGL